MIKKTQNYKIFIIDIPAEKLRAGIVLIERITCVADVRENQNLLFRLDFLFAGFCIKINFTLSVCIFISFGFHIFEYKTVTYIFQNYQFICKLEMKK